MPTLPLSSSFVQPIISLFLILSIFVLSPKAYSQSAMEIQVENPGLISALNALKQNDTDENRKRLKFELNKAVYLIPVAADPKSQNPQEFKKDDLIMVLLVKDKKGNQYVPLFTDLKSIDKWTSRPVNTLAMPARTAWKFVLSKSSYNGAVINPGSISFLLGPKNIGNQQELMSLGLH